MTDTWQKLILIPQMELFKKFFVSDNFISKFSCWWLNIFLADKSPPGKKFWNSHSLNFRDDRIESEREKVCVLENEREIETSVFSFFISLVLFTLKRYKNSSIWSDVVVIASMLMSTSMPSPTKTSTKVVSYKRSCFAKVSILRHKNKQISKW